ncbi:MAG: formylglycine-generating enzyme family protein [Bacteroidetes bacterium]|nr:formylglycine-generating enzyme family protein [Bacteroidota bacterium]
MQHSQTKLALILLVFTFVIISEVEGQNYFETIGDTIPGTEVYFTMVALPGGTFVLGTPENEVGHKGDEGPQQEVNLSPFYIGIHEVTYDEFLLFSSSERDNPESASGTQFDPDLIARPSPPYEDPAHGMGTMGHPAVGMTQWSALQYTYWLSSKTGIFFRLPTEAEWEYACRAGQMTAYSFGETPDSLDVYAWYYGNSDETYHAVGQKAPNPWGIFDMHGNVAEWVLDEYSPDFYEKLDSTSSEDPWNLPTRLHPRTVRGGTYDDSPESLRCGSRLRSDLDWKRRDPQIPRSMWWNTDSPFVGFRIVRPMIQPSAEQQREFWSTALGQ